jgi:hypothetical protein
MIDDLLITPGLPPFDCQIIFSARCDNPKRNVLARDFPNLRIPRLLLRGEMEVALKRCRPYVQAQPAVEKIHKTVKTMVRSLVALIDEGISALNWIGFGIIIPHGRDVGIVLPQVGAEGSDVGKKSSGIPMVQIANCRSQHHNVPDGKTALQNQFLHR